MNDPRGRGKNDRVKFGFSIWLEMHRQGLKIEDAKKKYTIENDFPYFKNRIVQTKKGNIHEYNIEAIWERISKK